MLKISFGYINEIMDTNYPISRVRVKNSEPERIIENFISKLTTKPKVYFEIGSNIGSTAKKIRNILPKDSKMYLFDFEENKPHIEHMLSNNTYFYGSDSSKMYDSYNWHLMKLFSEGIQPDFVFIDGKHTFDTDWLCFFLIDKMIRNEGYIYFDDYEWSLATSQVLNPKKFPQILNQYTDEQISTKHIKILVDNFVHKTYKSIIVNKLYQKCIKK